MKKALLVFAYIFVFDVVAGELDIQQKRSNSHKEQKADFNIARKKNHFNDITSKKQAVMASMNELDNIIDKHDKKIKMKPALTKKDTQ